MDAAQVAHAELLPAVIDLDKSCVVYRLCQIIDAGGKVLLLPGGIDIAEAPGFIERNPCDHTWMIVVTRNSFPPLGEEVLNRPFCEFVETGHLLPYKHTENIGPIIKSRVFNLLVFPHTVEPHSLHERKIVAQTV